MTTRTLDLARLPEPLDSDNFRLLRTGIYDDGQTSVYVNTAGDFAVLDPFPATAYDDYTPRSESLGLAAYRAYRTTLDNRRSKLSARLDGADSFLEIGAADGAFLALLHEQCPTRRYATVESDTGARPARDAHTWLQQFDSLADVEQNSVASIGMFHVFEHLVDPQLMLADIHQALTSGGQLLVEVPCLLDPLLSVFASPAYADFYFQQRHPYVYTGASLARVLVTAGFDIAEVLPYQRYGLENHLHWLRTQSPGGNPNYRNLFAAVDGDYRGALEVGGHTDSVIVVAQAPR